MKNRDFYIQLGRLLYAVAMADGEVQDEELHALYNLVVKDLHDEELFGNEDEVESYYTEFEFEALLNRNADKQEAFSSFIQYLETNHKSFNKKMKKNTLHAVQKIAEAYEGIIPEEQKLLDELQEKVKILEA